MVSAPVSGWQPGGGVFDLTATKGRSWHSRCGCGIDGADLGALWSAHLEGRGFERLPSPSRAVLRLRWEGSAEEQRRDAASAEYRGGPDTLYRALSSRGVG